MTVDLEACAPERLVRRVWRPEVPRNVVAIGKCAGALLDGIPDFEDAFVIDHEVPLLIRRSRGIDQEYVILSRRDGEGTRVCRKRGVLRSFAVYATQDDGRSRGV